MSERSLEELKELARPALHHAELVNLARGETPNKAYELASLRWPRRQAKAARSLAMVRRDHGSEALEAFILEHARPTGSEHAQGGTAMELDLAYPENVRDVSFALRGNNLYIMRVMGGETKEILFKREIRDLDICGEPVVTLVSRILKAMLAQLATPKAERSFPQMWAGACYAVRTWCGDDNELVKEILTATVIYEGGRVKGPMTLAFAILPKPGPEPTLQDVINYLLESGFTEDEVRETWVAMLRERRRHNFKTAYITCFWEGLKVGEKNLQKEVEPVARELLLQEFNDILVNGCFDWNRPVPHRGEGGKFPEDFMKIVDFLLSSTGYDWHAYNEETQELVENYFVVCIARGKVSVAFYMLIRYGKYFGLWDEYGRQSGRMPSTGMERLMRAAIGKAEEQQSFGIAAALAEHVGDSTEADRLREQARHFRQRVALDFFCYYSQNGLPILV